MKRTPNQRYLKVLEGDDNGNLLIYVSIMELPLTFSKHYRYSIILKITVFE